jgi:DnaJ-class molecular chaperone
MGKQISCPNCQGTGFTAAVMCPRCQGTGQVDLIDDWGQRRPVKCFRCLGTGVLKEGDTCTMDGGSGEVAV